MSEVIATLNQGNTAFVLICASFVWLMTPSIAMFYAGMVRKTNVVSTVMQCLCIGALLSIGWVVVGYSLAFGGDIGYGLLGDLSHVGLQNIEAIGVNGIPGILFASFQMMFAIIAGAIIVGSLVERVRFGALLVFSLFWSLFVYAPLAHWIWSSNGWLLVSGSLDFAGGGVVHISAGMAGLVGALMLGKRYGYATPTLLPHSIPYTFLGAGLLWFGWLGFNAGSALAADGVAANAFMTSNIAAFSGIIAWVGLEWILTKKPSLLGAITGGIAGLVAITPGAGFVSVLSSIPIGFISALICYFCISFLKYRLRYDDALDAFGLHGVGGIWGGISVGLFASGQVNPLVTAEGALGEGLLIGGDYHLLLEQLFATSVCVVYAGIVSFVIFKLISLMTPLRVEGNEEILGLDVSAHSEKAYRLADQ